MSLNTCEITPSSRLDHRRVRVVAVCNQPTAISSLVDCIATSTDIELHVLETTSVSANESPMVSLYPSRIGEMDWRSQSTMRENAGTLWAKCGPGPLHERAIRYSARIDARLAIIEELAYHRLSSWWRPSLSEGLSIHFPVLSVPPEYQPKRATSRRFQWLAVLDGSETAEAILRPLASIARWLPSDVTLVQPLEYARLWPRVASNQSAAIARMGVSIADSNDYLLKIARHVRPAIGVRICCISDRNSKAALMRLIDSAAVDGVAIGLSRRSRVTRWLAAEFNELLVGRLKKPSLIALAA